ncbi:carbonic anhydrase family protein [Fructilactobacillus sanfranciscensis]|uniref:carbonic anhydrase family protein n=1 Tax=Fructilactobacillus sanfranciscensis TaxID=1625 RepID=UPI0013D23366|nr:carbonic anhydrase family protein [Fructilactobacillus sanfranciscensis]NDR77402.1 carbonic anhydrase family protein [Fructilactobacillus sanfranciscensis]
MLDYSKQNDCQPDVDYLQSPIDIRQADVSQEKQRLSFKIEEPLLITIVDNLGNNLKFSGNGSVEILQRTYQFQQAHFHHPTEHLIGGQASALEVHLFFTSSIGQTLVLALLFKLGKANDLVQQLIEQKFGDVDLQLPNDSVIYHYLGSLTTPPLQTGVEWLVVTSADLTLNQGQLDWFTKHFPVNARRVQPLQKRPIEMLKM